ncbi:MAG: glucose PTS transporter subunit IIA [Lachnospiraceae bacterium]|nr:glucose PTS transporter subunit IIA [Lachnospiraceae bacterium]
MKDRIFGVLQRIGRSFMLPIAILPVAGLLMGIGSSFTNATTIETYRLTRILGEGTVLHSLLVIMNDVGSVVFDNLPLLFAIGVAIGMAKKEKEVAALASVIAYFVMNAAIRAMLEINGRIMDGEIAESVLEGTVTSSCGIYTLQMGVFGGIIVGLGVAALHNRFYRIQLPNALSFFGGSRFVPIVSTIVYMLAGILLYFIWPVVQTGIYGLGNLVTKSGYIGTLLFGLIKRALIPFGLHHVFYMPFWQTAVGGTMEVAGRLVEGGQNIFFAQLADSANVTHFSADATRYFSGEFIFMIFGLPGAALAMYHCAYPGKKKQAGGLLLSAALTCMATGITEPLEFSFLFVAPALFAVQVVLAGSCYMVAHMLNIAIGLTFSGGFLDFFLFGILQGNAKTGWLLVIPVGVVYFFLYYFIFRFLILKFDFKTPGREEDDADVRLYTKADVNARKDADGNGRISGNPDDRMHHSNGTAGYSGGTDAQEIDSESASMEAAFQDPVSAAITRGLGGKNNIEDVDCCATRLRCTVKDSSLVNDALLRSSGASGVIRKGKGVQVIYGPQVTVIKSNLEEFLENVRPEDLSAESDDMQSEFPNQAASGETETVNSDEMSYESMPVGNDTNSDGIIRTFRNAEKEILTISSPITGTAAPLGSCPDPAFAEGMMGEGAIVTPTDPIVRAPEDGEIDFVFDTKHAIGFITDTGVSILIHIGIDTVELNGCGFEVLVKARQKVKKGDPILKLDLKYLREHAPSLASPVLFAELPPDRHIRLIKEGAVKAGEPLFEIRSAETL